MTSLIERKITNISLTEALISIKSRNLELIRKIISERNLKSRIHTKVEISELDKKIRQTKKIEGCNLKKDRRNTTTMEMIM
jgi:hypothetical protein